MKIGSYYYPEQWPADQWERDFDRMQGMGLQLVHLGEFAWGTIEPAEGEYRLDWLEQCVEMASRRKMQVILCTPTAVLPVWAVDKFPDILFTNYRFGGRRHGNHLHPAYQDLCKKVTAALAKRFGHHPAVIGWQIDNELNGPFDQSQYTHQAFRQWLKQKYGSIDGLNIAWGNQFWNTFYTDFGQITMPENRANAGYANPHQHLDASRFWSASFAGFLKLQADILRPAIGSRWITTNFMPFFLDINPLDAADVLDMSTWDAYPVSGSEVNPANENFRMADPTTLGFTHDQMSSYQNRWGLMELQPGQVNWSGVPVLLYPGAVRLWIWSAFAHGAEFVTTYRFRQPLWGVELFHYGLMGTDGQSLAPGGREFVQTIEEVDRLKLDQVPPVHEESLDDTVGLVLDFDQLWWFTTLPQAKRWSQPAFLKQWYSAIARLGLRVKILHPNRPWPTGLKMIVAPGLQMVDEPLVAKLSDYAEAGGHLVLTCRTGLMNRHGHLWEGPLGKPILPLICASIEAYDSLPEGTKAHVELSDGEEFVWNAWGDLMYAEEGTRILAKYADQFYAGAVAATQCKRGAGFVSYSGVYGDQAYCDALIEKLAEQADLPHKPLPARVELVRRGPYTICLNYTDQTIDAPAKKGVHFVVGSAQIEPAGVAVWEDA